MMFGFTFSVAQQSVSFFTQFSEYHHGGLQDGTILKFDDVKTNVGGAYHPELGQFVAPVTGTYAFYVNLLSDHDVNTWINFCIVKDGLCVALTQLHDAASMSVVLELQAADTV
nr:hypothetical protein BaRGS_034646 [Batillaria attramentaria]